MLTNLHIRNFKAWKDTGKIRLAPLTVFFGANSSGKSSLSQFLLMLKQTAQSPDRQRVLHPGDSSSPIDLGTYQDMAFGRDGKQRIEFSFEWKLEKRLEMKDLLADLKYAGETMRFHAVVGPATGQGGEIVVWEMKYRLGNPDRHGLTIEMKRDSNGNGKTGKYVIVSEPYKLVRNPGRPWSLPSPTRFYGFPEEVIAYHQNADIVGSLALALEKALRRIHYLGPLRRYPQRSYTWSGEIPEHVGWQGERAVDAILSARQRRLNLGKNKRFKSFDEMIAHWLKEIGLIESFEVKKIAANRREYEVLVRPAGSRDPVNVTDAGFGVSQILPVLVACFYCERGSTLILEQPEIHLHPAVQAALADVFIAAIKARDDHGERQVQLLIESHSEHFLRRLQRRVAEEEISPEQIAIYFCEGAEDGSRLHALDVDMFGNITNWPPHFFGDELGDLAAMTEAAIRRQQETSRA